MAPFKTIGLIGRPGHVGVVDSLRRLLDFLSGRQVDVVLESITATLVTGHGIDAVFPRGEIGQHCDLVVVVGGDGSMLNAAHALANSQVPVIGVNRGRLGFLTDILPEDIDIQLGAVLDGKFTMESRFLLDLEVIHDGERQALGCALNDVVLHPGQAAQMIEFELFINDRFVYSQESDGLIVATPTGSTAYALSAGGPIMHPSLNAMVLVPMYPHTLSSRPIVVDGDSEIRMVIAAKHDISPQLSCDGKVQFTAVPGDVILVRKRATPLQLVHPLEHSFFQACRSKLGWGNRLITQSD